MNSKQKIFLTGFPGFIAAELIKRLIAPDTQFFLLVQENFLEKARAQVAEIAVQNNLPPENFVLMSGDITAENLGLSAKNISKVIDETTQIFHLAAVYDLAVKEDTARRVNVEGTRNVNEIALRIRNLQRYNYVSTCYIAGLRTGLIRENELEHRAGFRNFYEESKYLAEVEVEKLKERVPLTIYRPSVVCGDSRTGKTAKYDGVYYIIRYVLRSPKLFSIINTGNNVVSLNLVPVDFIVDAIAALAQDETAIGKTFQLADPEPLTTAELFNAVTEAVAGRRTFIGLPMKTMQTLLNLPVTKILSGMPKVGVPYFFVRQNYDTTETRKHLAKQQITCPNFRDYVSVLVEFVKKNPNL